MVLDDIYSDYKNSQKKPAGSTMGLRKSGKFRWNFRGPNAADNSNAVGTSDHSADAWIASSSDRLAAFIVDLVLLTPVFNVVTSPLRRLQLLDQLSGAEVQYVVHIAVSFIISCLVFIAYQSFFIYKWKKTPGMRFFSLEVRSMVGEEKPKLHQAIVRSGLFALSVLSFGFFLLGALTNPLRRAWHDRLADTILVTISSKRAGIAPHPREKALAHLMLAFGSMFILIFALRTLQDYGKAISPSENVVETEESCGKVESLMQEGTTKTSLSAALSLKVLGLVDPECLSREADRENWRKDSNEADLALASQIVLNANHPDIAKEYTDQICEKNQSSDLCLFAKTYLSDIDDDDFGVTDRELHKRIEGQRPNSVPLHLWAVAIHRQIQKGRLRHAMAMIPLAPPSSTLSAFLNREQIKTLFALGKKDEAKTAIETSLRASSPSERIQLAKWVCLTELSESCSEVKSLPCSTLADMAGQEQWESFIDNQAQTALYKRAECLGETAKFADDYPTLEHSESFKSLIRGNIKSIAFSAKTSWLEEDRDASYYDLLTRRVNLNRSLSDLKVIEEKGLGKYDPNEPTQRNLALTLLEKYLDNKAPKEALNLAIKIYRWRSDDEDVRHALVVASYRADLKKEAQRLLAEFHYADSDANENLRDEQRRPASFSVEPHSLPDWFTEIKAELQTGEK